LVRGTFQTDPISALGLPPPVSVETSASVGEALRAVQAHGQGYVLVVESGSPVGIMSEREVLMRIVARDVKYEANVRDFMSSPARLLKMHEPIANAVRLMGDGSIDNIPVVDDSGKAVGVLRTMDIIHFLAEAFPEQVLNLPPRPHQTMRKPEGG
jgi:signal-transduction protein with cAMP-binding, CBS, and nucleotidyltransferase domain